jgi:hypothetical protein
MHSLNDESSITEESFERKNPSHNVSHEESNRLELLTNLWRHPRFAGVTA